VLNLVILPQALRVIIPPLTSQMLNLTKNSSLAVAIGYPDFVSVAGTTINQTGQAIEGVALMMIVYLTLEPAHLGVHELVQQEDQTGGAIIRRPVAVRSRE
jgi:ABC-type amino acid transport system permease subunit